MPPIQPDLVREIYAYAIFEYALRVEVCPFHYACAPEYDIHLFMMLFAGLFCRNKRNHIIKKSLSGASLLPTIAALIACNIFPENKQAFDYIHNILWLLLYCIIEAGFGRLFTRVQHVRRLSPKQEGIKLTGRPIRAARTHMHTLHAHGTLICILLKWF